MKERGILDGLVIGYNKAPNGDIPVLIVGRRKTSRGTNIINSFAGKEAEELYLKLVGAEWKESPIDNQDLNKKLDEQNES